ncbi:MAG: extracellular solute-binding protein [Lachnospiraceae bacterium]|nr:extracellular solute-binding protein [Lachnospiraceae bacterium]
MKIKKVLAMCLMGAMVLGSLAGCGKEESGTTASVDVEDPAWQEAMTTPYGKYPETVVYTLGKTATNFDVLDGTEYEGDDDVNNAWTRYLKEKLNIQNTNLFEANDGDDYEQKVSMAIVSGEIPDIMVVGDYATLKQLYENDLIADLTEVYENCASDKIKEIYDSYDGVCLETATFDGKLMGLPTTEISHGPGILWLRKDWMDKCNLAEPKTMEDIYNILQQFLVQDPGGNGEGQTAGLVIDPEIAGNSGGSYMPNNIFTLYGAYPKQWIDDGSGNAVYGSVQPQMKEALEQLSKMYSEGLIDKQFVTRTGDDRKGLLNSGKSGAFFGNWWGAWEVADSMSLNKEAEWVPYICPVGSDGKVTMFSGNPNSSYVVVRKEFEHPELVMKIASMQFDYSRYQEKDEEAYKELTDYGELNAGGSILATNIDYYDGFPRSSKLVVDALESGDISQLNRNDLTTYLNSKKYLESLENGEESTSSGWASYNSMLCASLVAETEVNRVMPVFFGSTQSMALKWPTLEKMEQEMLLKIITGEKPVDYFDEFVETWNKTGGEQITEEVNQAIKK